MIFYPMSLVGLPLFLSVLVLDSWIVFALILCVARRVDGLEHTNRVPEIASVIDAPMCWVKRYLSRKINRPVPTTIAWVVAFAIVLVIRHVLLCLTVWSAG